ncbi:hypothetical protein BN133_3551 [Cronobacter dublinensis 582]|nr:hypothetical protein BN133_3551 [Cronobacter dublinensis 582]
MYNFFSLKRNQSAFSLPSGMFKLATAISDCEHAFNYVLILAY